jgi:hypothetical protein
MLHKIKSGSLRTNGSHFFPSVEGKFVISFVVSLLCFPRYSHCQLFEYLCCTSSFGSRQYRNSSSTKLQRHPTAGEESKTRPPTRSAASGYAAADAHAAGARCRRGGGAPGGRHHYRADPEGTSRPAPPRPAPTC